MPLHWHVNAGPVAYSRPMRKKHGKSGPLTSLVTWFIVKPLEWTVRGTVYAFTAAKPRKPYRADFTQPVATRGQFAPPASRPGWYDTAWGPLYWNGSNWFAPDGRPIF